MTEGAVEEIKREWSGVRKQLVAVGLAAVSLLSIGATFFHITQKLSWIDAFYFCTVSLTTVGYGDITPQTTGQKLFIIFYILVGIGIVATFANLMIKSTSLRREYRSARKQFEKVSKRHAK